jgi:hypothetical protein
MKRALVFLLAAVGIAAHAEDGLRAGVARVEITPTAFMQMYGYTNRTCGPANGTHDPLFAKALVLESGDSRMAIVTMDLGSIVSDNLRRDVASKLHIPVLFLSASHTHSAPSFLPYGSSPSSDAQAKAYLAELEGKVFGAIQEASKVMFPARLSITRGSLQLGYNRLLLRDDGRARALFDNLERVPYGQVDPEYILLGVDDSSSGARRALLVHYAVHAVVLGPTSCKYSADYPGAMQARVERELAGTQVMFVQGGAGDVNPLFMARSGNEAEDFKVMQKMGELFGGEVLRTARNLSPIQAANGPIQYRSEVLTFRNRWEKEKTMDVGITTVLIGRDLALAAVPGEVMHKLQKMWKEQADVPYPLFYGYTFSSGGTWAGYVPDLHTAAYGGYGADVTTSIEVGAGERIIQQHLINLYDMRGMWRDKPGRP